MSTPRLLSRAATLLGVPALALTALTAATSSPAHAADADVTASAHGFGPRVAQVGLDDEVTWTFTATTARTVTSDEGFWSSDPGRSGESFAHVFTSAGRFAYHSKSGADMHGAVAVPVRVTGSAQHGYELRWSTIPGGRRTTFDVEVRPAGGSWHALRRHTDDDGAAYDPGQAGRYQVRARTDRGTSRAHRSGWSPAVTVLIS